MKSRFQYRITRTAESDLDGIVEYIAAELSNPDAASKFLKTFESAVSEICNFPEIGTPVLNEFLPNRNVRKKLISNYVMYYLPDSENMVVYILRVVYGKRNLDSIIREL